MYILGHMSYVLFFLYVHLVLHTFKKHVIKTIKLDLGGQIYRDSQQRCNKQKNNILRGFFSNHVDKK